MKLIDIVCQGPLPARAGMNLSIGTCANAGTPEVIQLIKSMANGSLARCDLLSLDERELADLVRSKWYDDPCYSPSMTLLSAIRSINAKVALRGPAREEVQRWNVADPSSPVPAALLSPDGRYSCDRCDYLCPRYDLVEVEDGFICPACVSEAG